MGQKKFGDEHRAKYLAKVQKLRDDGYNLNDAVGKAGHSVATYRKWKKELDGVTFHQATTEKPKRKYSRKPAVEIPKTEKVFAFYGTPEDIAQVIGRL